MGGTERRQRGKITYLASWFIIDALGCPWRQFHGYLGQILCLELGLLVASIGQAPKERGDRVLSAVSQNARGMLWRRCQPLALPFVWPETVPSPSCTDPAFPVTGLALLTSGGHLLPHLAQRRCLFLLQLRHPPYSDSWCHSEPFKHSRLATAHLLGGKWNDPDRRCQLPFPIKFQKGQDLPSLSHYIRK